MALALSGAVIGALATAGGVAIRDETHDDYEGTVMAISASGAISAEAEGWTYNIPLDVRWQDSRGSFHDSGRPECLPPSGKAEGPIRFRATAVNADGVKFRQVYFVQCI